MQSQVAAHDKTIFLATNPTKLIVVKETTTVLPLALLVNPDRITTLETTDTVENDDISSFSFHVVARSDERTFGQGGGDDSIAKATVLEQFHGSIGRR